MPSLFFFLPFSASVHFPSFGVKNAPTHFSVCFRAGDRLVPEPPPTSSPPPPPPLSACVIYQHHFLPFEVNYTARLAEQSRGDMGGRQMLL